jgi:putative spermidine/putrescine transport system substrate-binding protein
MSGSRGLIVLLVLAMVLTAGCGGAPAGDVEDPAGEAGPGRPFAFVSWGGSFGDTLENVAVKKWATEGGIDYVHLSPTDYGKIKAMVEANTVEWDVCDGDGFGIKMVSGYGGLEPLDFTIIDTTGIPEEFVHDHGIYLIAYATVLAWNTDTYSPGQEPKSWADFWDIQKFPGKRGLYDSPHHNIEIALLADGVPISEVYPFTEEKIDRAFRKLDEIKPHTIFWETGAIPPQLLSDGEVVMTSGWNGRFDVVINEGAPVKYTFNQGILGFDALFVVKGTPYREEAMELVNYIMSPQVQADIVKAMPYGPCNLKAFDYLDDEYGRRLPTHPDNLKLVVVGAEDLWADYYDPLYERWVEWKVE